MDLPGACGRCRDRTRLAGLGPHDQSLWLDTLIADVSATMVIFVFSRAYHNSSFYDAYWSVIPPLLLVYWWARGTVGLDAPHCWLVAIAAVIWAVRLTTNWARTFPGLHHEDWRYPMLKQQAGRGEFAMDLFAIHLIPKIAGLPRHGAGLCGGHPCGRWDG